MASVLHSIEINQKLNEIVGPGIHAFLTDLGIRHNPKLPIPDQVTEAWIVVIVVSTVLWLATRTLTRVPQGRQHVLELILLSFKGIMEDTIGHDWKKHFNLIATLGIFIFCCNFAGMIPYNMAPTSNLNTTVACAIIVFLYYNYQGIKKQGILKYFDHFMGPHLPWYLFPIRLLMLPIELISHCARPLSLSMRLFGNILGEDIVIAVLLSLVPFVLPLPMMFLGIFTSFLQAFIFVMLSIMYIGGAVAEEH